MAFRCYRGVWGGGGGGELWAMKRKAAFGRYMIKSILLIFRTVISYDALSRESIIPQHFWLKDFRAMLTIVFIHGSIIRSKDEKD